MNAIRKKLILLLSKESGSSYINVMTPIEGYSIPLGAVLTIAGTTDFPIGTAFDVTVTQNGTTTTIGQATVISFSQQYNANLFGLTNWTVVGQAGSATFTVSCGTVSGTSTVTLYQPQPKLSIDSSVSADTPTQYVHHTDVSITSTVTADTPTNI